MTNFLFSFVAKLFLGFQLLLTSWCGLFSILLQPLLFILKAFNGTALGKSLLTTGQVVALSATSWIILSIAANATALQWHNNIGLNHGLGNAYTPIGEVMNQLDRLTNEQQAQILLGVEDSLQPFPISIEEKEQAADLAELSLRVNMGDTTLDNYLESYIDDAANTFQEEKLETGYEGKPVGFFANLIQAKRFQLVYPLMRFQITSHFGWRHGRPHKGMDLSAAYGSGLYAAEDGVVVMSQYYYGYGNLIVIDHGNGLKTRYAHLDKMIPALGSRVKKGSLLGTVGMTGRSTGPHVHFEVLKNNVHVNPYPLLKAGLQDVRFN